MIHPLHPPMSLFTLVALASLCYGPIDASAQRNNSVQDRDVIERALPAHILRYELQFKSHGVEPHAAMTYRYVSGGDTINVIISSNWSAAPGNARSAVPLDDKIKLLKRTLAAQARDGKIIGYAIPIEDSIYYGVPGDAQESILGRRVVAVTRSVNGKELVVYTCYYPIRESIIEVRESMPALRLAHTDITDFVDAVMAEIMM